MRWTAGAPTAPPRRQWARRTEAGPSRVEAGSVQGLPDHPVATGATRWAARARGPRSTTPTSREAGDEASPAAPPTVDGKARSTPIRPALRRAGSMPPFPGRCDETATQAARRRRSDFRSRDHRSTRQARPLRAGTTAERAGCRGPAGWRGSRFEPVGRHRQSHRPRRAPLAWRSGATMLARCPCASS